MKSYFETCSLLLISGRNFQLRLQVGQCALVSGIWIITLYGDGRTLISYDGDESGQWLLIDDHLNTKKVKVHKIQDPAKAT